MTRLLALLALAALAVHGVAPGAAQGRKPAYDWDAHGTEFCRLTLEGDLGAMRPLLSTSLAREIEAAAAGGATLSARTLFQSYTNEVPICQASTRSAAIVEVRRSSFNGQPPAWTEYLVMVPEADGSTRIDDVLFATRRSDTLRARLVAFAAAR